MHFPDPVIFELPVRPRVAKFIHAKLTDRDGNRYPILVSPQALGPGLMLWAMAQSEKIHLYSNYVHRQGGEHRPPAQRRIHPEEFTAVIGVGICEFHKSRSSYLLNYAELMVFSNLVDQMIRNELIEFCDAAPHVPPMTRIKAFTDRFDFSTEDFNEQTLRTMYLRYRKGISSFNFAGEVARSFSFERLVMAA